MPRTKLRPENTTYVYAYDILGQQMPDIVFDVARAQRDLWNYMAAEHLKLVESLVEATKEQKNEAYKDFWLRAYEYVRDEGEARNVPCMAKWQILDSFKRSQAAWAAKRAGIPSIKHGLRRIQIENRTTSGKGASVEWIFRDGDRKPFHLRKPNGLTRGYFKINDERVHFETVLHRSMEPDCTLKRYSLCGEYEPAFREWRWKIVLVMERPPRPAMHGNTIAAMDLGWRLQTDGLRLGVLYTAHGARELFLPFNLANRSERKQTERYPDTEVVRDIRDVWELQSLQDSYLEECKATLREMSRESWPEEARESMSGIVKMRAGGLRRLRRALHEAGVECQLLDAWLTRHIELSKRIRRAQQRIFATRNHIYRNLASWLSRHVAVLAWEDDLSLKTLAEEDSGSYAIENAQKHRQFAGLSILRGYIREKMAARIPAITGRYTTQECNVCGAHIEPGSAITLTCENGHRQDQDVNAARVLFSRLPEELRAVPGPDVSVDRSQILRCVRPISA